MKPRTLCGMLALSLLFSTAGCREKEESTDGGSSAASSSPAAAADSKGKPAFPKAQATATIAGKVIFTGEVPTPKSLRIQGDKFCEHHAADNPPKNEALLVNEDKTLRNAFVHITKGLDQWSFEVPGEAVVVTQKGCTYHPHVLGIQVGQTLQLTSDDNTTHNVHFIGKRNREFNLTQKKGQTDEKKFTRKEVGTAFFKCDIHSWMKAHVGIVGHPFYAVTADGGTFDLGKLPAGEYEVEVWHETLGSQTQTVTVKDGETTALEFSFGQK